MKEHERAAIEKAEKLTAELEKSPMLRKLREDEAAETLAKRKAAADRIKELQLDLEACGILQREIDGMIKNLQDLDIERARLQKAINEKAYFLAREKGGIEGETSKQNEILLSTYDPEMDKAIEFFREKLADLRKPGRISYVKIGVERNIYADTKKIKQESNEGAVLAALEYCQEAIRTLGDMKLLPEFDAARIEALKNGIPRIDVYVDSEAVEKPLDPGPNPGFLAKMRAEADARIDRLLGRRAS